MHARVRLCDATSSDVMKLCATQCVQSHPYLKSARKNCLYRSPEDEGKHTERHRDLRMQGYCSDARTVQEAVQTM
jgi:hypothetical protein